MNLTTDQSTAEPGYRCVIVIASAIMLAIAMGVMVNGFSVFFTELKNEFGWQRGAVSLVKYSGLLGLALGGIIMGRIADQSNTRIVRLSGATTLGIVAFFGWVGHAIGGSKGGFFYDLTGNYTLSYANAAIAGVINLVIVDALYITISRRRARLEYT